MKRHVLRDRPPKVGATVIFFVDGEIGTAVSAKVLRVQTSGWSLELELSRHVCGHLGLQVVAGIYAPYDKLGLDKRRPPFSWDFVV